MTTFPLTNSRASDPATSVAAAQVAGRKAMTDTQRAVATAQHNPGCTAGELASLWPWCEKPQDAYVLRKRLADGRRLGLLVNGLPRKCGVDGTEQQTWLLK